MSSVLRTTRGEVLPKVPASITDPAHKKFLDDLLSVLNSWNENQRLDMGNLIDVFLPVGSFYVQFPDANSNTDATAFPTAYGPATLFGGTWAAQWNTEAIFFRTQGNPNASELQATGRTNGLQYEQAQRITGNIGYHREYSSTGVPVLSSPSGAISIASNGTGVATGVTAGTYTRWLTSFDSNNSTTYGTARQGYETRAKNRLIKVWKRTA